MKLSVGRRFAGDEEGLVAVGSRRQSVTRLVDEPASDANQRQFAFRVDGGLQHPQVQSPMSQTPRHTRWLLNAAACSGSGVVQPGGHTRSGRSKSRCLSRLLRSYLSSRAKRARSGALARRVGRGAELGPHHLPVAVHSGAPGGGEIADKYEATTTGRVLRWRRRRGHVPRPIPHPLCVGGTGRRTGALPGNRCGRATSRSLTVRW